MLRGIMCTPCFRLFTMVSVEDEAGSEYITVRQRAWLTRWMEISQEPRSSCVWQVLSSEGQMEVMQRERMEMTLRNNLSIFIFFRGTSLDQKTSKYVEPGSQKLCCDYTSVIFMWALGLCLPGIFVRHLYVSFPPHQRTVYRTTNQCELERVTGIPREKQELSICLLRADTDWIGYKPKQRFN